MSSVNKLFQQFVPELLQLLLLQVFEGVGMGLLLSRAQRRCVVLHLIAGAVVHRSYIRWHSGKIRKRFLAFLLELLLHHFVQQQVFLWKRRRRLLGLICEVAYRLQGRSFSRILVLFLDKLWRRPLSCLCIGATSCTSCQTITHFVFLILTLFKLALNN